jgi:hypothetical protein
MKILRRILSALLLLLVAAVLILWLKPPALLRVGANYSAKIVCSNVFLAARNPDQVLSLDVQAPGIALLRFMHVSVDRDLGVVHAGFLGFIGDGLAQWRPGKGCTVMPDGVLEFKAGAPQSAPAPAPAPASAPGTATAELSSAVSWPDGTAVHTDAALDRVLQNDTLAGPARAPSSWSTTAASWPSATRPALAPALPCSAGP